MKKIIKFLCLSVLLIPFSTLAANHCINEMQQGKRTSSGELDLIACDLADSDIPAVVNYLQKHPRINHALDLDKNPNLTPNGIAQLGDILYVNAISFDHSKLGDAAVIAFARASKTFAWVSFIDNNVSDRGVRELANNPYITWLKLSKNPITKIGARALANNPSLTTLDMNDAPTLGPDAAIELAKSHLQILALHSDNIGDSGAQAFKNAKIDELYLGDDNISNQGFATLVSNPHFTVLDLEENNVSDLTPVKNNQSLHRLNLYHNKISNIAPLANHKLLDVILNSNLITDESLQSAIGQQIFGNLDMSHNQITNLGAFILVNLNAYTYDLRYNYIGIAGVAALKAKYGMLARLEGNERNQSSSNLEKLISTHLEHWKHH